MTNSGRIKMLKNDLFLSGKLKVKESSKGGYGVFADEEILSGKIIEECHWIDVGWELTGDIYEYRFCWPKIDCYTTAIPLGYACIYNTADSEDSWERNADWDTDEDNSIFVFYTLRDIEEGEEILTYYGDGWFEQVEESRQEIL